VSIQTSQFRRDVKPFYKQETKLRFALLIYSAEADRANLSEQETLQNMGQSFGYTEDL
jgi:hypothetical protein